MEADWEIEMGLGAPVIDALWEGFVDLTKAPVLTKELPEVQLLPWLEHALIRMNAPGSPVWTVKCDVWPLDDPDSLDPYEFDAEAEDVQFAWACYVDLLPRGDQQWATPFDAIAACKLFCAALNTVPLQCCRADLIVRSATTAEDAISIGVTAYLTACGATGEAAKRVLGEALARLTDAVLGHSAVE